MSELTGLRAVVTGGTRGIGYSIVRLLMKSGANVLTTGRAEAPPKGATYDYQPLDLADPRSVKDFAEFIRKAEPDILVNNAGITIPGTTGEVKFADFQLSYQMTLVGPLEITKAALSSMRRKGFGRIVSISAARAISGMSARQSYGSSKAALEAFMRQIAVEYGPYGVTANSVCPGLIKTDLLMSLFPTPEALQERARGIPTRNIGTPEEIARAVLYAVSPEYKFLNGARIVLDGGVTIYRQENP